MKVKWLICIGAAAIPLGAANAQGLRVEALAGFDTDGSSDGALLGARIGYDFRAAPNVMIGIDGEGDGLISERKSGGSSMVDGYGPEIYAGGRATFVVPATSNRLRLFAGAGYSRARLRSAVGAETRSVDGFRLTAGAQISLGGRAFLGAEYRYSDYGDRFAPNRNQLVGSIGFRF